MKDEYYNLHRDHAAADSSRPAGARVFTLLMYLSDVDEGGETYFPRIDVTIEPRRGRAVLWSNTLSEEPQTGDSRAVHQALPVKRGVKYAANAWIHLYDYQKADLWACTGTK